MMPMNPTWRFPTRSGLRLSVGLASGAITPTSRSRLASPAAPLSQNVTLTWGGSGISGVKEKSLSLNNEPIDITSDMPAGATS
jgi:hypothetical protein